jgi:hypothetical protein
MLLSSVYQAKYSGGRCEAICFRQVFHKRLMWICCSPALERACAEGLGGNALYACDARRTFSHRVGRRRDGRARACLTGKNPNCQSSTYLYSLFTLDRIAAHYLWQGRETQ